MEGEPPLQSSHKPAHAPFQAYQVPRWALHPDLPTRRVIVDKEAYHLSAAEGNGNTDNWNVAHVAAFHDDLKLLSLATPEQCREPNKWGLTPAHMCAMGQNRNGPALSVLYELVQLGCAHPDALDYQDETPLQVCQKMQKPLCTKKFEQVLLKGKKPDVYDSQRENQLRLRGKFAQAVSMEAADFRGKPLGAGACLLFPGQGSQYVGMMKDCQDMPAVKDMLAKSKTILGYDILDIMLNGTEEKLAQTKYCQPAMYIAGLAAVEKLKEDKPDIVGQCQAVAGLSSGEYAALKVAGVFDFETGLRLVKARAEAMDHETTKPGARSGAMLSVAGLPEEDVTRLCKELAVKGQVCQIAHFLFPKGFSISGDHEAVMALEQKLLEAGALQAKVLKTSGAFHTSIMEPAAKKLLAALTEAKASMQPPRCRVYMNRVGNPLDSNTDVDDIVRLLGEQIVNPVNWDRSMKNVLADGVTEFYECGPSKQLKSMMKRIDPSMVSTIDNISV